MNYINELQELKRYPCAYHKKPLLVSNGNEHWVSCLNLSELKYLAKQVGIDADNLSQSEILKEIHEAYPQCNGNELCIVDKFDNNFNSNYKPIKEPEVNEWLYNIDIEHGLEPYSKGVQDFLFLGAFPINFDTVTYSQSPHWNKICSKVKHFKVTNYLNTKKRKFGFVFNLDPHYRGGSHWVCSFVDLNKKEIYYYNSSGSGPPSEILAFIHRIKDEAAQHNIILTYKRNKKVNQEGNTECGVYCMFMISGLARNCKFNHLIKIAPDDENMYKLRGAYFQHGRYLANLTSGGKLKVKLNNFITYK